MKVNWAELTLQEKKAGRCSCFLLFYILHTWIGVCVVQLSGGGWMEGWLMGNGLLARWEEVGSDQGGTSTSPQLQLHHPSTLPACFLNHTNLQSRAWYITTDQKPKLTNPLTAYYIAFGAHGPRAQDPPNEGWKVFGYVCAGIGATFVLFGTIRMFAKGSPSTMNKEYQEATNEYLKVCVQLLHSIYSLCLEIGWYWGNKWMGGRDNTRNLFFYWWM